MILKNPYGYLIKHFKLIHLILLGMYIYLAIYVNSIFKYYNDYIAGRVSKLDAITYINNIYVWVIGASILICVIVYSLMRYKHKPRLLYMILIVFYMIVGFIISMSYDGLNTIYLSVLESKVLRLYRDLLQVLRLCQFVSIGFVLVRALGFDIKKFNFVKDLNDLNLTEADVEEIEVTLGGTESFQRRFNRRIREFGYYYLENKSFVIIILVVVIFFAISGITVNKEVVNKEYKEGEVFSTDDYRFNVMNTYITSLDWRGKTFVNSDTTFVIVRINLGVNGSAEKLNTSNLLLRVGNNTYTCSSKYADRFSDLGDVYRDTIIKSQNVYLFVYNILLEDSTKKMSLEYAGKKKVKLSPVNLDTVKEVKNYKINEKITFLQSSFRDMYFLISSYEVKNQFSYSYQYDILGQTNTANLTISNSNGSVLHVVIDSNLSSLFTKYEFLSNFAVLKYKVGDDEKISSFSDKTPASYNDGLYLAVDSEVMKADSIWLEISIRMQKYKYVLK